MNRIRTAIQLLKNMGFRYMFFRINYFISKKTGFYKLKFPVTPPAIDIISLDDWKKNPPPYLFTGKNLPGLLKKESTRLELIIQEIKSGLFTYFGKSKFNLGTDYDWITNPVNNYKYDINKHWSQINDLSEKNGDIKFIWEKARFAFLSDLIRYDYHYSTDCSRHVFNEISSFIDKNPINRGPNYICSQEISLRILNWTFALYYYKDSEFLNEELFRKIMNSIYWQIHHVYNNINFSRIAVRNNHAITETLLLYFSKLLFPFLPDVEKWSKKGRKWFEQEIEYQIYYDGTYLQFSNNYHRVVIQLLTLAIRLSEINKEEFGKTVLSRAKKSLDFLYNSMDPASGELPNYGSNDGALFFRFNDNDYRDFRPQLQALLYSLDHNKNMNFNGLIYEDLYWLGINPSPGSSVEQTHGTGLFSYPSGGFYIAREKDAMTWIRCGVHKDRPAQADNLHLDIWFRGVNVFRDNGSYLYNCEPELKRYFMGTRSHNTIMLDDYDQMLKGPRFIWFNWSQARNAELIEQENCLKFEGSISAFTYLSENVQHKRSVIKIKAEPKWIVEDEITGTDKYNMVQVWHFNPDAINIISIKAKDEDGKILTKNDNKGWYSSYYGAREESEYWTFITPKRKIITEIDLAK
jgi:hypothetical protein